MTEAWEPRFFDRVIGQASEMWDEWEQVLDDHQKTIDDLPPSTPQRAQEMVDELRRLRVIMQDELLEKHGFDVLDESSNSRPMQDEEGELRFFSTLDTYALLDGALQLIEMDVRSSPPEQRVRVVLQSLLDVMRQVIRVRESVLAQDSPSYLVRQSSLLIVSGLIRNKIALSGPAGTRLRAALASESTSDSREHILRQNLPGAVALALAEHGSASDIERLRSSAVKSLEGMVGEQWKRNTKRSVISLSDSDSGFTADQKWQAREEAQIAEFDFPSVVKAMKLAPQEQTVFALRVQEGLPLDKIAERLGLSEGSVKSVMFRVREKAARLLKNKK